MQLVIKHMWRAAIIGGMVAIWKERNHCIFEETSPDLNRIKRDVYLKVHYAADSSQGTMHNSMPDLLVLRNWNLEARLRHAPRQRECKWSLPLTGHTKINCDGAASGNPGPAGLGVIFRGDLGEFLGVFSKGIGLNTNFLAECLAIIEGLEIALTKGWVRVMLESDSTAAIQAFSSNETPWQIRPRWERIKDRFEVCSLNSVWREVNFSADTEAKQGALLPINESLFVVGRPTWITSWEDPNRSYFRFH